MKSTKLDKALTDLDNAHKEFVQDLSSSKKRKKIKRKKVTIEEYDAMMNKIIAKGQPIPDTFEEMISYAGKVDLVMNKQKERKK